MKTTDAKRNKRKECFGLCQTNVAFSLSERWTQAQG